MAPTQSTAFASGFLTANSNLLRECTSVDQRLKRAGQIAREQNESDSLQTQQLPGLPTIVVAGTQSSGKSSALNLIAGIRILVAGDNTCTRCPTRLEMLQEADASTEAYVLIYQIGSSEEQKGVRYSITDAAALRTRFLEVQTQVCSLSGTEVLFSEVQVVVEYHSTEIEENLVVVDLLGLCPGRDEAELAKGIILHYLRQPDCVLVIVSEAGEERDRDGIFTLLRTEGRVNRVIIVHNKLDKLRAERKSGSAAFLADKIKMIDEQQGPNRECLHYGIIALEGADEQYVDEWTAEGMNGITFGVTPLRTALAQMLMQGFRSILLNADLQHNVEKLIEHQKGILRSLPPQLDANTETIREIIQYIFLKMRETVRINIQQDKDFEEIKLKIQQCMQGDVKTFVQANINAFLSQPYDTLYRDSLAGRNAVMGAETGQLHVFRRIKEDFRITVHERAARKTVADIHRQLHDKLQQYLKDALVDSILDPLLQCITIQDRVYNIGENGDYPGLYRAIRAHFRTFFTGYEDAAPITKWWRQKTGFAASAHGLLDNALQLATNEFQKAKLDVNAKHERQARDTLVNLANQFEIWFATRLEAYRLVVSGTAHASFVASVKALKLETAGVFSIKLIRTLLNWATEVHRLVTPQIRRMQPLETVGRVYSMKGFWWERMAKLYTEYFRLEFNGRLAKWATKDAMLAEQPSLFEVDLVAKAPLIRLSYSEGQAYHITISVEGERKVDFGFQSMTERAKWLEAIKIHLHKGLQPEYENLADNLSQLLAGTPAYSDNAEENAMATRHRTGDLSFEARAAREAVINDIRDKCQVASEFAAKKYAEFRQAWRQGQPMVVDDDKLMNERLQKIYKMLQYYVSASAYLESELLAVVVKCFYLVEQERMQEDVLRIRCITSFCNQYPSQEDLNNLFRVRDASYAHRRRVAAELVELYSGALTDIIALNEHSLAEFE
eukprot:m.936983 g.936983  ORF g.936983 m.936983 type:complete len:956 (-) comp23812_c0_seq22:384-3251(-)